MVTVIDHPLVQHKLTLLRKKETTTGDFRRLCREISLLLGYEVLRDLPLAVRAEVLRHIPASTALALRELLGYEEDEAGGIMTTALVTARSGDKVKKVVEQLSEARAHDLDLDAVAVVDSDGRLLGDVGLLDILLALRGHADVRPPRRRGRRHGGAPHAGRHRGAAAD